MSEVDRWLEMLEEKCCRITGPRQAIVELMVNSDHVWALETFFDQAREKNPRMGLVTVYRTLEILTDLGLVERVHQMEGCHMYMRAARGHEHIMLCKKCGKALIFPATTWAP